MFYASTTLGQRVSVFSFILLIFVLAGCRGGGLTGGGSPDGAQASPSVVLPDSPPAAAGENSAFSVPSPNINLANPLVVSDRAEDAALCAKINETIEKSPSAGARWGVFAVSLKDGRVVCSRDGRKLFNPASIQKTLTAIIALDKLGADYRWNTSVYASAPVGADGTLDGDLVIYGQGAPDFDSEALANLVGQLQAKGLKRVRGGVVGDSSYFRGDPIGDGWTWNELQWYYGAEASALSFNENQAFINVENGEGRASNDYLQVTVGGQGDGANANSGGTEASGIKRGLEDNNFYVWGNTKSFGARVSVHNPAKLAAKTLKEELVKRGIVVDGDVRSRDWKSADKLGPAKATELAVVQSRTLGEVVKRMNKHSVNLYAELLLRTVGKKFSDTVPADIQRPQNVRGDDVAGAAVLKRWLMERHIAADEVQIADGSGLSRLDFVTPESFARAFIAAAQSPYAQAFTDSLPVAATDGTLGGRLSKVKGKVLAKTGTITFVNSLAGYADSSLNGGEVLAFAVITNNDTRKNGGLGTIDSVAAMLVNGLAADDKEGAKEAKTADNNRNTNSNANEPNFVLKNR